MFTLFALWVSFALAIGHHLEDNPSTSVPILDTFPEAFCSSNRRTKAADV